MYEKIERNLCDADTGEKIEEPTYRRKEADEESPVKIKGGAFMKAYDASLRKMYKELTPTEIAMVLGLAPYVSYTDCCLRHKTGELMDANDIATELGIEKRKAYRLLSSLEKKGVIGYHVTGSILKGYEGKLRKVYTVNPFIFCRGVQVNRSVYEYYRKSGWRTGDI